MRMSALVLLLALGACGPAPQDVEVTHAFVRRTAPRVDTLRVPARADTLRLAVEVRVLSGRAAWRLEAPDGAEAWAGAVGPSDTVATWSAVPPRPGDWRLVLAPDSAMGVARVEATIR